ncbi:MAG: FtsX-like permease family protein, partial [Desulfobulbaceae bacterium]|nr:FtsX-like permease family protein [Desulfobulbaceae bacterium]
MKRLISLPFLTSLAIAYKSIRVRFFRTLITTISLILAVAFFSFSQVNTDIAQGILTTGNTLHIQTLAKMGYDIEPGNTLITSSTKQRWLIFLSLLVCIVGIINAQLMSVTERFREIGTMKCLGALDSFIIRIFVIEAALQGSVGSIAGALLGAFTALVTGIVNFGTSINSSAVWKAMSFSIFLAIFIGTVLSLLGVLYP